MWVNYPLVGSFNRYPELDFDGEDTVNLFWVKDPKGKKGGALFNTPGTKFIVDLAEGSVEPTRALFTLGNQMFGVFGSGVYYFDAAQVPNLIGTMGTNDGYVSIATNNADQIIFVDGQKGYVYNVLTGVFGEITDPDFPTLPINVAYLDTYFVIPSAESQTFQLSANNDGTSWNGFLDTAQIQTYPGVNMGVGVVNERLYFFKNNSTEIWYNPGDADFPLRKDTNLIFNYGCLSTASIVSDYGYLLWLAQDNSGAASVMLTTGYMPQRVSTKAVEATIGTFTNPADVQCYLYKEEGHIFYVMNWTTDDYTLVLDITENEWHRMEMQAKPPIASDPSYGKTRHVGSCHAFFNDAHYIGSYKNQILYEFSRQFASNAGEPIRRIRTGSPFADPLYRPMQINRFQVDIVTGIADQSGPYADPSIFLSVSRDGGHVFGNQIPASMGRVGKRQIRCIWRKKGLCKKFVPRIEVNAVIAPIVIMGAAMDYEVLPK